MSDKPLTTLHWPAGAAGERGGGGDGGTPFGGSGSGREGAR